MCNSDLYRTNEQLYAKRKRWGEVKCPYCKGKNLYLKRTFPVEKYGCRDCENKVKYLRECGLNDKQIEKVLKGSV